MFGHHVGGIEKRGFIEVDWARPEEVVKEHQATSHGQKDREKIRPSPADKMKPGNGGCRCAGAMVRYLGHRKHEWLNRRVKAFS
jgi:hypothetical protein